MVTALVHLRYSMEAEATRNNDGRLSQKKVFRASTGSAKYPESSMHNFLLASAILFRILFASCSHLEIAFHTFPIATKVSQVG